VEYSCEWEADALWYLAPKSRTRKIDVKMFSELWMKVKGDGWAVWNIVVMSTRRLVLITVSLTTESFWQQARLSREVVN
jgi:hypothetical protein